MAHHWAAERLYLSSDVGRPREALEADWQGCCFRVLPSGSGAAWWHTEGAEEEEAAGDGWWEGEEAAAACRAEELDLIDAREPAGVAVGAYLGACLLPPGRFALRDVGQRAAPCCFCTSPLADAFLRRVERLRQWLARRPESALAVVTHWGVLHALTGAEFHNCEVRTVRLGELRARPHLLRQAGDARAGVTHAP